MELLMKDFDKLNAEFKEFVESLITQFGEPKDPNYDFREKFSIYKLAQFEKRIEALEKKNETKIHRI